MKPSTKKWLGLLLIGGLFCVFFLEGSLRVLKYSRVLEETGDGYFRADSTCPFALKENSSSQFVRKFRKVGVHTNSLGLRGAELDERPKVLLVGDSMTFGFGLEDDETISSQLEVLYPEYQFVNAGFYCGNSPESYALGLKKLIPQVQPELVVFHSFQNDLEDVTKNEWTEENGVLQSVRSTVFTPVDGNLLHAAYAKSAALRFLRKHSYIFKVLRRNLVVLGPNKPSPSPEPPPSDNYNWAQMEKYASALRLFHQTVVDEFHLPLVVFLQSGQGQTSPTFIDQWVSQTLQYLPLTVMVGFPTELSPQDLYIEGDGHYNAEGARLVAKLLGDKLFNLGLLDHHHPLRISQKSSQGF